MKPQLGSMSCTKCGEALPTDRAHQVDHPGLCCDCADIEWGTPLEYINKERADKGQPPLPRKDLS